MPGRTQGGVTRVAEEPTHGDIYAMMLQVSEEVARLGKAIGEPNDTKDGGSGLIGISLRNRAEVAQLKSDIDVLRSGWDEIKSLKSQGIGFVAAVGLFSALIILGVKDWVSGVVKAVLG